MTTSTGRRGYVGVDRRWLADDRLSDGMLRLMLWLDSHSDEYLSALSVKRTAEEIGWSRDRVKRTLDALEELGLVSTQLVPHLGSGKRTYITLDLDAWTGGCATPRGTGMPHGKAQGMPHGKAPTTSTHIGETNPQDSSSVVASDSRLPIVSPGADFDLFWLTYGNLAGTGRRKAVECWDLAMRRGDDPEVIIEGLRAWVAYWRTPGAAKAMFAQGFLNQQKWATPPPPIQHERMTRGERNRQSLAEFVQRHADDDQPIRTPLALPGGTQ